MTASEPYQRLLTRRRDVGIVTLFFESLLQGESQFNFIFDD